MSYDNCSKINVYVVQSFTEHTYYHHKYKKFIVDVVVENISSHACIVGFSTNLMAIDIVPGKIVMFHGLKPSSIMFETIPATLIK